VTEFSAAMSDNICPGKFVWAKFAQTLVKWPGRLVNADDSSTNKYLVWVESEKNWYAKNWCFKIPFSNCNMNAANWT
jgi:hypothetical protein